MISQIINTCIGPFIKGSVKDDQPKPITMASLPPRVLQILKEVDCTPPEALASLEKDIAHFKSKSKSKFSLTEISLLGAGIVLTVAKIASAIFGQILLASSLAVLGIIATIKYISSLDTDESIDKRVNTLKANLASVGQWLNQIKAKKQDSKLSEEQLKVVEKAYSFGISQLENAKTLLSN